MMKSYVDQGGEQVYAQPFSSQNTTFYGMFIEADMGALQRNVCDRLFNEPLGEPGRFIPAGPFVLLAFCNLTRLFSDVAPYSQWGSFGEQECAFWVLTVDTKQHQVFFAFPYIWVDNAYALSMGREIYGFPKQLGKIGIPTDPSHASEFSLDTMALKTLNPQSVGAWMQVLTVQATTPATPSENAGDCGSMILKVIEGLHASKTWSTDPAVFVKMIGDLAELTVPFIFLKQFRDCADGTKACYQSVVQTGFKMTKWLGGGLMDSNYQIVINDIGSLPIVSDLGLTASTIEPIVSFWCSFDFEINAGVEVSP